MDVPMKDYSVCEVSSVIRFLRGIGQTRVEIHEQLKCVYGPKVMMTAMVGRKISRWNIFKQYRSKKSSQLIILETVDVDRLLAYRIRRACKTLL